MQSITRILTALRQGHLDLLSSPWTAIASIVAMLCGFLADQFGRGYWVVLVVVLLVFFYGIWEEDKKAQVYTEKAIPLPIVINISNPANSQNALNSLFDIIAQEHGFPNHRNNLSRYLKILEDELIFEYRNDIFSLDRLTDFLKITRFLLERLKSRTPRNTTLYLAYIGPASVGILIGTMFGTDGVRIFQYNKSSDSYFPVVTVKGRSLKRDTKEFEKFEVQIPEVEAERVTVAIDVTSHKIKVNDPTIVEYGDLIYMSSKNGGTIDSSEDWLQYTREILAILNRAQVNYQEIRLIYSMPVGLSVTVGMAIQNYWNLMLTNYDRATGTYKDLIRTNAITYYY